MSYHLLTGATGLLGSYLLCDGLRSGQNMAVLVRPTKRASARQRIEDLVSRWERDEGRVLPRPVVLQGDLSQIDLGLDGTSIEWITNHCGSMIHNAASLTFSGTRRDGEPWHSNVTGTGRILELCRCTEIRQFHYVSTAYVCGLREGRVLESELDVGQELKNDYEKSKLEAECLVREADFLDSATFYRPGIIVGDSRTGRTTGYHGFYVVLKLAHTIANQVGVPNVGAAVASLGLTGVERKHFVPVDWVSAVISHIHRRPEHHGKTYHLTAEQPTPVSDMADVIHETVEADENSRDASNETTHISDSFAEIFRASMAAYRSYWSDDPEFDRTNTVAAAPQLPCPMIDRKMLAKLAKYALDDQFGRRRVRPRKSGSEPESEFDMHHHLRPLLEAAKDLPEGSNGRPHVGLQVDGPGGGQWTLAWQDGRVIAAEQGLDTRSKARIRLDSKTFGELATDQFSVSRAVRQGKVIVEKNGMARDELASVLRSVVQSPGFEVRVNE